MPLLQFMAEPSYRRRQRVERAIEFALVLVMVAAGATLALVVSSC
jgi:hypothetical protein